MLPGVIMGAVGNGANFSTSRDASLAGRQLIFPGPRAALVHALG
jgi:hypothetical protein